jgi:glycosyltransferase involved in cell wall biosynthesis
VDGSGVRCQYNLVGKTVIGFIGTFGKWHGAEVLAEAFGQLLQEFPVLRDEVRLFLIGDGLTMPLVKEQLTKFDVMDACILTGMIPQEEGPAYLAACDILASPHVPNPDGTPFFGSPTKLFEYMAMGKGIVASDLEQIGEVLTHDQTAWMVKPGDAQSLKLGLKVLIDDQQRRERLGEAARREVVSKYTWREHTRKIIDKLKERWG